MRFFRREPYVRFLVSCCNRAGGIYLVEVAGRSTKVLSILDSSATGLAVWPERNRVYVGHPDGVCVLSLGSRQQIPSEAYDLPGAYVHDVKVSQDGSLIVVETGVNSVVAYERPGAARWTWTPGTGMERADLCHINSIVETEHGMLTSMFTPEGLGAPWKERLDGAIMKVPDDKTASGTLFHRGVQQPHSLVEAEGSLWWCESRRNRVLRMSGFQTDAVEVVARLDGYARGLCVTENWIAVGQSRSDAHFVRPLIGDQSRDVSVSCGLWMFPRGEGDPLFVPLPGEEVYDVLLLPE